MVPGIVLCISGGSYYIVYKLGDGAFFFFSGCPGKSFDPFPFFSTLLLTPEFFITFFV